MVAGVALYVHMGKSSESLPNHYRSFPFVVLGADFMLIWGIAFSRHI